MEKILLFNLSEQSLSAVKRTALVMKIKLQQVTAEQYNSVLEDIINGEGEFGYNGELPAESMIVLCGIAGRRLEEVLMSLRKNKAVIDYKAVLTQHNCKWTPLKMLEEMEKEKKAFEEAARR